MLAITLACARTPVRPWLVLAIVCGRADTTRSGAARAEQRRARAPGTASDLGGAADGCLHARSGCQGRRLRRADGRAAWMRPLLLAAAAALACFAGRAAAQLEPPLLGASLTWAVDRNFNKGTRKVTFTLRSAFAYGRPFGSTKPEWGETGNPNHNPGDRVKVKEPFSAHGQRFGVLSIVECLDSNCQQKAIVNIDNDFEVQTHDSVKKFTAGILVHERTVPADVVAVLAYLTFKPDSPLNIDSGANNEVYSLYPRYAKIKTGPDMKQDWSALLPPAAGATVKALSWESCSGQPNVLCTSTKDCADQGAAVSCGAQLASGSYVGAEYFGKAFLDRFPQYNGGPVYAVAATFVHLCCSQCSSGIDREVFGCGALKPRLKNYYSPVPSFPLAVFQGYQPRPASVRLKVADYDGHILRLMPLRSQNPSYRIATIETLLDVPPQALEAMLKEWRTQTLNTGRYKFHDYFPAEGPVVRLETPSIPDADASAYSAGRMPATRQVLEVQDFLWPDDGIEDSLPNMLAVDTAAVTMGVDPDNDKPTATTGGSTSQVVFSTFFQQKNFCPSDRLPLWNPGIPTEIECKHNDKNCFVALKATTGIAASKIDIVEAPGFENLKVNKQNVYQTCANFQALEGRPAGVTRWDTDGTALCGPYGALSPCGCCKNTDPCPGVDVCPNEILSKKECRYNMYNYNISHVGVQRVMCFVATADYCKQAGEETQPGCSDFERCYSQPLCVRFNIVGHRPKFVAPTPLQANSQDALGRVVPGRTDVAACLGRPLPLSIMAVDEDPDDQVRIFIDDEIRPTSFFSSDQSFFPSSSCGAFKPFAGVRVGINHEQDSIVHLLNAEWDSTITASLNSKIAFNQGNASQDILYKLTLEANNGIDTSGIPGCGTSQTCRQRLLNMPRILCGYAYDNSRSRYARWVGRRAHPELHRDARDYVDDHSLGSYASDRHCWKVTLQSPPVFVTNSTGCISRQGPNLIRSTCTPFGAATNPGSIIDTTKNRMAYPNISLSVQTQLDVTFVAFDPNPEDRVQLFVMEDPGIPPGMIVGRSICVPRTAQLIEDEYNRETCPSTTCGEEKCECGFTRKCNPGADESVGVAAIGAKCGPFLPKESLQNPDARKNCPARCKTTASQSSCDCTGFCPADLSCNRASMRLQWKPREEDFGKSFLVCVTARDNSNLCLGQGIKGVTERGWYGEQQCMYLNVVPPAFAFEGPWIEEFIKGTSKAEPFGLYVGCTFTVKLTVLETSDGASYGGKIIRSYALSTAPADFLETATNVKGEKMLEVVVTQGKNCADLSVSDCSVTVDVTPRLGSEGSYFQLCFSAGDQLGMVLKNGICIEDPSRKPCNLDSDCSRGGCLPLCFDLRVEKCRYCIKDGPETLRAVKGQYMIDTNWMRLWTLNADSFGNLGTECKKYFDCAKDVSNVSVIDNPELILPHDGRGKRILWTGVLYNPMEREKAKEIACRFRTGLKSLQHNNPEMQISDGELILQPGDSVCIGSCDAGTLLSSDGVPTCPDGGGR